ncbi:histidine--tRNA ligase [Cytobacillus oceanisediminis]|uniref:Histidine--tRNA ligase n=1 Tax=Cytobacillus oceanisediminis TaxID=665099 RepID=A0ABX3CTY8_9BACI|nr:histidine--tRNA ligase [Cytobacillus oceanisediminis]MBY0154378.1 histidine--tRNA ligase [Cytobacillus firmus]MBU8730363.1 histidine--tRNA ligase [Cytobacillus oceanisediminis]MCM3242373.1 histidine--tRNA ligase [Cytobacillus oceanisediminis]MCM3529848.1 histidine--tRNA ligase [Cytobacillus oceanisediminis]MCS0823574.1 histidine--tRNA ligase [Cytobacillus firmus]
MSIRIPRGTQDILPGEVEKWQLIEKKARELCEKFQYREIRTPIFEHTELFLRSVGDTTDIVQKEMYTFEDRGGRSLTLRPEGTASAVRSFVEHKMYGDASQPVKLYYMGPMFRYERPQAGRFRQFVQFGVEAIGSADPAIDAEVIALAMSLYRSMGLQKLKLIVNSLGDKESRSAHREALVNHFKPRIGEFCQDCQNRLEKNPMRILDCKQDREHELMKSAPSIIDYLNDDSKTYFEKVQKYLKNLDIDFIVDPNLVRGLDYYNHTAFEIMSDSEGFGAITTLCGGGRYNGLTEEIGGPEAPGIGFALSIERFIAALEAEKVDLPLNKDIDCYLVSLGEEAKDYTVGLLQKLRMAGYSAERDYLDRKIKAQFKAADRSNAKFVAVLGEDELKANKINVKSMESGEQTELSLDSFIEKFTELYQS